MNSKGFLGVQSDHKNGTFDYLHQFLIFSLHLNMKSRHFFHRISKHDSKYLKSEKLKKKAPLDLLTFFYVQSKPKSPGTTIFLFSSPNNLK